MSTRQSTWSSLLRMDVQVGEPYRIRRRRTGWRLHRWLMAAAACALTVFAVQVTVIGSARAALYDEQEYLHYPGDWLETIQIDPSRLAPAPVSAGNERG